VVGEMVYGHQDAGFGWFQGTVQRVDEKQMVQNRWALVDGNNRLDRLRGMRSGSNGCDEIKGTYHSHDPEKAALASICVACLVQTGSNR